MFDFLRARPGPEVPVPQPAMRQVGCFGKLPIQPEYIRHNLAQREARALDQWLQEGVGLAARGRGDGSEAPDDWVHNGVFDGTEEDRAVLFTVRPSHDQSGRQYPFVVFEIPGPRGRDASAGFLPLCSQAFFDGATAVMRQPWRHEPLPTVPGWVDRIADQPRVPARAALGDLGAERLLDDLYPGFAAGARVLHLQRTVELMRQVERRTAPRVPWGVRLPLTLAAPEVAISWWLRLPEGVLGRRSWRPCYLWRSASGAEGACGDLLLFFRTPPTQLVTYLLQGRGLNGVVVDPSDGAAENGERAPATPPLTTTHSLLEWLTRRGPA